MVGFRALAHGHQPMVLSAYIAVLVFESVNIQGHQNQLNVASAPSRLHLAGHPEAQVSVARGSGSQLRVFQEPGTNMTLHEAIRALPPIPPDLERLLGQHFGKDWQAEVARSRRHGHTEVGAQSLLQERAILRKIRQKSGTALATVNSASSSSASSADDARLQINRVLAEAMATLDEEEIKCKPQIEALEVQAQELAMDLRMYESDASSARSQVFQAQTQIAELTDRLPKLLEERSKHVDACNNDVLAVQAQVSLVMNDSLLLGGVAEETSCTSVSASFMQDGKHHTRGRDGSALQCTGSAVCHCGSQATSFFQFRKRSTRRKVAQLRTVAARRELQHALEHVASGNASSHKNRRGRRRRLASVDTKALSAIKSTVSDRSVVGKIRQPGQHTCCSYGCRVNPDPDCDYMRNHFLAMQTRLLDKADSMKGAIHKMTEDCAAVKKRYDLQIDNTRRSLGEFQIALGRATASLQEANIVKESKSEHVQDALSEVDDAKTSCVENVRDLSAQICGLKQVRAELYKMEAQRPYIQDCVVSDWTPEQCSATCGGGTQTISRMVVVPATLGTECPPLKAVRSCQLQKCPVDCELGAWEDWSACSAECDRGLKMRVRPVLQKGHDGGRPCGATTETVSCNVQSCDLDCKLSDWTGWQGNCSKACDGGFVIRSRQVVEQAQGEGICPSPDDASRMQYKRCNTQACVPESEDGKLQCKSKIDLIVLLEGSAAMTQSGWDASRDAAAAIIDRLPQNDAMVALVLFSGPLTLEGYRKCSNSTDIDLHSDCKVTWVSHFTSEKTNLVNEVNLLKWPKGSSLSPTALASVDAELLHRRREAIPIVLVISDGNLMAPTRTHHAAEFVRGKAKLMWVRVNEQPPDESFKKMVSKPVASNLILLSKYDDLPKVETVNHIIANLCPEVS